MRSILTTLSIVMFCSTAYADDSSISKVKKTDRSVVSQRISPKRMILLTCDPGWQPCHQGQLNWCCGPGSICNDHTEGGPACIGGFWAVFARREEARSHKLRSVKSPLPDISLLSVWVYVISIPPLAYFFSIRMATKYWPNDIIFCWQLWSRQRPYRRKNFFTDFDCFHQDRLSVLQYNYY